MELHSPEEFGFSADRMARINVGMQRFVDEGLIAGIVTLVARRSHVVHFNRVGYRNLEAKLPMEQDTIFRIYSMSKPITSAGLMMLYEQGLVHLEDPLSKFVPEFKSVKVLLQDGKLEDARREITVYDLLTHTAGFSYGDEEVPIDEIYREANLFERELTLEEAILRLASLPLAFHPGGGWRYSVATDVVGRVIEIISEQTLAEFLEENICGPMEMKDTGFSIPPEKLDRFSTLYGLKQEDPMAILDPREGSEWSGEVRLFSGGHGLLSTTMDYYRFAQLMANGGELDGVRLLGPKTVELMVSNHIPPNLLPIVVTDPRLGHGWGLGVSMILDVARSGMMGSVGLYGWGGYANTHFWVDPVEEIIGLLMLQYLPSGTYPITNEFRTYVYQALME